MDNKRTAAFVKKEWIDNVLPSLMDFIRIPNLSPAFDEAWDANGHQLTAFDLVKSWAEAH